MPSQRRGQVQCLRYLSRMMIAACVFAACVFAACVFAACGRDSAPPRDTIARADRPSADSAPRVVSCSADARPGLEVAVRDATTGTALGGYTIVVRHDAPGAQPPLDSVTFPSTPDVWRGALEQAGRFALRVTRPGYRAWDTTGVVVARDACHVMMRRVDVGLSPMR